MKERQAALIDLHYDVLKEIVIRAARSSDGAKAFAKTISVCKDFRQFVDDRDVLRAVCFDDLLISGGWELFQLREGLICRCAQAGHVQAQFILAKIILVRVSQLLTAKEATDQEEASSLTAQASYGNLPKGNAQVSSFLENFLPDQTCPHFFIGFHFNFVKLFLSRARVSEFQEMELHLKNYMEYVIKCRENDWRQLFSWLVLLLVAKEELGKLVAYVGHKIRDMRLCVYEKMQILEPKAEEAGTMKDTDALFKELSDLEAPAELKAEGVSTMKDTSDALLKELSDLEAAVGEVSKARQHSVKEDAEHASSALSPFLPFSCEITALERATMTFVSAASFVQEDIAGLISDLEGLLCCQLTMKHKHDIKSYYSWLPFLRRSTCHQLYLL